MRNSLLLLFFLTFIFNDSSAQWEELNSGVTDDLQSLYFPTPDTGYVGGAYGLLLRTIDGGETWENIGNSSFNSYVSSVKFINKDEGYVHGWGTVLKTTNAGQTWQTYASAPSWHYFAMDAWDDDHMTIVGRLQVAQYDCHTTQTGPTGFTSLVFPGTTSSSQYHAVQYLSQDVVKALRFGGISTSTDGGSTWVYNSRDDLYTGSWINMGWNNLYFPSETRGYVVATDYTNAVGLIFRTNNGGSSFQLVGNTAADARDIHFVSEDYGFVSCNGGYVYKTIDGGDNWYGEQVCTDDINDIFFVNENIGYFITATGRIFKTTNGGVNIPTGNDMSIIENDLHDVINISEAPFTIKAKVRNEGADVVSSFDFNYTIDNGTVNTTNITGVALNNFEQMEAISNTSWTPVSGTYTLKIWLDNPNGGSDDLNTNDTITKLISVLDAPLNNRKILMEDATGAWCGYCPGLAVTFDALCDLHNTPDQTRIIPIAIHNGDDLAFSQGNDISGMYDGGSYPSGWIDRFKFYEASGVRVEGDYQALVEERLAMDALADVNIDIEYDENTREAIIDVSAYFVADYSGELRFNCYILEDSLLTDQANYYNDISGSPLYQQGNPIIDYVNNHVLRAIIGDTWGVQSTLPTDIVAGSTYAHEFNYTLPANFNEEQVHVLAFVSKHNEADVNKREIVNSNIEHLIPSNVGLVKVDDTQLSVSPNPFTDIVEIEYTLTSPSHVKIEVYNAIGELVYSDQIAQNEGHKRMLLNDLQWPQGVYIISVEMAGKTIHKKVIRE